MERIFIAKTVEHIDENVLIQGWVRVRRDHGKLIFLDVHDATGMIQVVVNPSVNKEAHEIGEQLRSEFVVELEGKILKRPEKLVNKNIPTGAVELEAHKIFILNKAETPPFDINEDGYSVNEETRLKYRYLDLRRERLSRNISLRHKVILFIRNFLDERNFFEIETPILTRSTPEGARDYVVPSRIYKGKFYALPQSPQQYKQLLMVAGFDRYFQIARCFRDEDTRGDRQPEFTQLDLEMSFVNREDVMKINEELLISIVKKLTPKKVIQEIPFPRISYKDAIGKYGTDRPDLRKDKNDKNLLAFCWIIDFPFFEKSDVSATGWTFTHNPFSRPKDEFIDVVRSFGLPEQKIDTLKNISSISDILTSQYDVALNGFEIGGGSIRNHRQEDLLAVFKILGYEGDEVREKFGHMLDALSYGAPPHGGIAWGLDRLLSILSGEPNIREVIAFPKTGDARDPMMGSPADIDLLQKKELGLQIVNEKK